MKACIFDLDGTLTNTLESMTYSVNLTLEEMGLSKITKDQCRLFVGNGARVLIEKSLKAAGDTDASRIEEGMEIYGRIFDRNCTYHVTPYEGIPEMLKALKDKGIHLAVLSNKPDRQTVKVVKAIFGEELFDYAQGQKEGTEENRSRTEYGILWNRCTYQKKNACISEIQKLMRQPEGMQALRR